MEGDGSQPGEFTTEEACEQEASWDKREGFVKERKDDDKGLASAGANYSIVYLRHFHVTK